MIYFLTTLFKQTYLICSTKSSTIITVRPKSIIIDNEPPTSSTQWTTASLLTASKHTAKESQCMGHNTSIITRRGLALDARSSQCCVCEYMRCVDWAVVSVVGSRWFWWRLDLQLFDVWCDDVSISVVRCVFFRCATVADIIPTVLPRPRRTKLAI